MASLKKAVSPATKLLAQILASKGGLSGMEDITKCSPTPTADTLPEGFKDIGKMSDSLIGIWLLVQELEIKCEKITREGCLDDLCQAHKELKCLQKIFFEFALLDFDLSHESYGSEYCVLVDFKFAVLIIPIESPRCTRDNFLVVR